MRGEFRTQAAAARACGTTVPYLLAALRVFENGNAALEERLLIGRLALLPTARRLRQQAKFSSATVPGAVTNDGAVFIEQNNQSPNEDRQHD